MSLVACDPGILQVTMMVLCARGVSECDCRVNRAMGCVQGVSECDWRENRTIECYIFVSLDLHYSQVFHEDSLG